MSHNPRNATAFVATMTASGLGSLSYGLLQVNTWHPYPALALFAIATSASRMKIKLPGLTGNMSVNLPFLLVAIVQLSLVEALAVTCASAMVQSFSKNWSVPKLEQTLFNLATMSFATTLAWKIFHSSTLAHAGSASDLLLPLAVAALFLGQIVPVSIIISLTGGGSLRQVWISIAQLTFPYFVLSAGVASICMSASNQVGWQIPLVALPVMFGVFRSYQMYFRTDANAAKPLSMAASSGR